MSAMASSGCAPPAYHSWEVSRSSAASRGCTRPITSRPSPARRIRSPATCGSGEVALSEHPERVTLVEQRYNFSCGELTTRLTFDTGAARADLEVVTFCSRTHPTIAAQEVLLRVDRACDAALCAAVDPVEVPGSWDVRDREPAKLVDGSMR